MTESWGFSTRHSDEDRRKIEGLITSLVEARGVARTLAHRLEQYAGPGLIEPLLEKHPWLKESDGTPD